MQIEFKHIPVNKIFFDMYSGDYMKKISNYEAIILSGGDYLENEIVHIEENELIEI